MKKILIGICSIWAAIFAFLIVPQTIQVISDDYPRVILKSQPVDPRDLFRGDYVTLSYAFASPNLREEADIDQELNEKLESILEFSESGENVYALLVVGEDSRAEVVDFEKTKPQAPDLFLRGKVRNTGWRGKSLAFGIEKYFVPEGKGRELEKARNAENLEVEVAINPKSGKALITDILVSQESYEFEEE